MIMDFFFGFSFFTGFLLLFVMGIINLIIGHDRFYNNKIYKVILYIGFSFLSISFITFLVKFRYYNFIAITLLVMGTYIIIKSKNN